MMITTDLDARDYVSAAIAAGGGATPEDYDMDAILTDLRDLAAGYPYEADEIEDDAFWTAVQRHERVSGF